MPVSPLSRRRLLLVEDDRMVRETIMLMLEDDYDVDFAVSVPTALAWLCAPDRPMIDVMLLDCQLPDGNLNDVLAEADQQAVPVVLISGDPHKGDGMNPPRLFLPKPFTCGSLLAILDTARG